ncbi:MFS transporter [soil metagenome]
MLARGERVNETTEPTPPAPPAPDVLSGALGGGAGEKRHDAYAALRNPNYRIFAGGFVVSSLGLQALNMAIGWEIYELTKSTFYVGIAGAVRALPVVIMALPAGWVIDHFHRRYVLTLTQVGFGLMSGVLALASCLHAPLLVMYAVLFCMGCVRSFNGPTRASLLPDMVSRADFGNAVGWNSGLFQFAGVMGPILGGALIEAANQRAWPVYAFTFLGCTAFALFSLRLKIAHTPGPKTALHPRDMLAGASHVWREKNILATISLDLFAVFFGGVSALFPQYCKEILHVGPAGLGLLRSAMYMGAIVMAVALVHSPPLKRPGAALLASVVGYGFCTIVFGFSTTFLGAFIALFCAGAFDNISVVVRHLMVQLRTPRLLRGRVSAVNSVFIECSNELGAFESGLAARWLGPVGAAVSGGVGTLLVVGAIALAFPQVRRLRKIEAFEPEADEAAAAK